MSTSIIYGSKYGTSEQYAMELARHIGISALPYSKANDLSNSDTVVYFGGIYAGGILGLSKTTKKLNPKTRLIVNTVGLSDPKDTVNIEAIRAAVKKQVPAQFEPEIFSLRGGIDYANLSFLHRTMMKMLVSQVKKIPLDEQTPDNKGILATYNTKVSFVDFKSLQPIIDIL